MATMKKEISLDYCKNVVKIVSVSEALNNCPVCGSTRKYNGSGNYKKMSPVQVHLFLALSLEACGGGGGGGDSAMDQEGEEENVQNFICSECMAKFVMLESLQNEISLLEDKVEEILTQLRKTIRRDRRRLISLPTLTVGVPEAKEATTTYFPLSSVENRFEMNTDDDEEEVDVKPVILDFEDDIPDVPKELPNDDDGSGDPLGGGEDSIPQQQRPINKSKEEEEDASANKSTRRCKIRATKVIANILRNDYDDDDGDLNDQYSPNNESDTDSDDSNALEMDTPTKEHYKRPRIPSDPSKELQNVDNKHICSVCGKQVIHLRKHMMTHRLRKKRFSCETCSETFPTKSDVIVHRERVHLQQLRYNCEKCGKLYDSPRELKRHLNMRIPCTESLKDKKFICPVCNGRLSSQDNLRRHKRQVHNEKEKGIPCPHSNCNSRLLTETNLQRHLELCHPQDGKSPEKISCTICNETFPTVSKQVNHIRSVHMCKFCNKSFPNKADRDEHKATHTGDQPYLCTKCGNKFSQRACLGYHLKKMTNCNPDKVAMNKIRKMRQKYKRELLSRKKAVYKICKPEEKLRVAISKR